MGTGGAAARARRKLAKRRTLDLDGDGSGDVATPDGVVALCDALRVNRSLQILDLSGNGLGQAGEDPNDPLLDAIVALSRLLETQPTLRVLRT